MVYIVTLNNYDETEHEIIGIYSTLEIAQEVKKYIMKYEFGVESEDELDTNRLDIIPMNVDVNIEKIRKGLQPFRVHGSLTSIPITGVQYKPYTRYQDLDMEESIEIKDTRSNTDIPYKLLIMWVWTKDRKEAEHLFEEKRKELLINR